MSKTPYEVRLELLKMAQDQLNQRHFAKLEFLRRNSDQRNEPFHEIPEFPSTREILLEADVLKSFVDKQ